MKDILKQLSIFQIVNPSYSPQTNGFVENKIKHIKQLLELHFSNYRTKRWIDVLPRIIFNINSTKHTVTKLSPILVHRGSWKKIWEKKPNWRKLTCLSRHDNTSESEREPWSCYYFLYFFGLVASVRLLRVGVGGCCGCWPSFSTSCNSSSDNSLFTSSLVFFFTQTLSSCWTWRGTGTLMGAIPGVVCLNKGMAA